jgi:LysR family transcriptional regulator, putative pyruvate carboxylase regulator
METEQLKGFIAVASEKSFSKAARKVYRTQSAVSLRIKALENELGVRLFDRTGRKTTLTKDGAILLELVSPLMRDIETLGRRFGERRGAPNQGELRIATHEPIIAHLLPAPLKTFRKQYPDVKVIILRKDKAEILASVLRGDVDLGISSLKKAPPSIAYQVIGRYNRLLVAPKDSSLARKKTISLKDLAEYPLLLPPVDTSTRKIVDQAFRDKGLDYKLALEASGRQAIKSYIEMGFGISVLNESVISAEDKKKFFIADASKFFGSSERGIIRRKSKHLSKFALDFIELLTASR